MVISSYKKQGKVDTKVIEVEDGMEEEKEVIVRHEVISSKWNLWNHDTFHVAGARSISSKKEKF